MQLVEKLTNQKLVVDGPRDVIVTRDFRRVDSAKWLPEGGFLGFRKRIQHGQIVIF